MSKEILCSISTRGRYHTTLPSCLMAVANQVYKPDHIIIYDDNDENKREDLRDIEIYRNIFKILEIKGITWEIIFGQRKGQHFNHEMANTNEYKWVWRVDDDCIPEANVLMMLYKTAVKNPKTGAVGGEICVPSWNMNPKDAKIASNKIEDLNSCPNKQWFPINLQEKVDHLHCSFLYRANVAHYNLKLSKVAHREETLFTYELIQKGYVNYIVPNATTWHLKSPEGGIRDGLSEMYQHDEEIFQEYLYLTDKKMIVLDCGIGDHIVFSTLIPELIEKYGKLVVACCYPDVFEPNDNVQLMSIATAKNMMDIDDYNIYKFMIDNNWKESLQQAYRSKYL